MASDIRLASLTVPIDVAEYLFQRLKQANVQTIQGLPGDYNLVLLDYVDKAGLHFVGGSNELNSAYAADGYARIKGISCVVTTFGVGELSAINGIAGAFSEWVPVVHVVGTPSTQSQASGQLLHHTLGNGDFNVFAKCAAEFACVVERLSDPSTIAAQIDHAIQQCYIQSRPAYITLPTDMVEKKIEGARLRQPIDLSFAPNDKGQEDYVVDVVLKTLKAAKSPVVLVDACVDRHRASEETHEFIARSGLPTFVAPMGKGIIQESLPEFRGVYAGDASHPDVRELVENSDLVISIGTIKSDFNTAGFSYRIGTLSTIDLHSQLITVRYSRYPGLRMNGVMRKISANLPQPLVSGVRKAPAKASEPLQKLSESGEILHAWFWPRLGPFLRSDDVIVTETGTANFGIWETAFPPGIKALNQILWGSIGWACGATQGAAIAAKEIGRGRTILIIGDGSLQLTVQEISTMLRLGLKPMIFIINNSGYTIERCIHGVDAAYNDIQPWRHSLLPDAFGAEGQAKTYQVHTPAEVDKLFSDPEFSSASCLQLVEIFMPKLDVPKSLSIVGARAAENNARLSN